MDGKGGIRQSSTQDRKIQSIIMFLTCQAMCFCIDLHSIFIWVNVVCMLMNYFHCVLFVTCPLNLPVEDKFLYF